MAVLKLLALMRLEYKAALLGLLASLCSTFASIGLMAAAGWFLSAMGAAYAFGFVINLFVPSALIRLLAIMRTGLRYADRLLSHQAAFKIIERLRLQLFTQALALDHAAQLKFQQADLERRLHGDIEKLELAYLREFVPCAAAFLTAFTASAILAAFSGELLLIFLSTFLTAGVVVPGLAAWGSRRLGAAAAQEAGVIQNAAAAFIAGLMDLTVLGIAEDELERMAERSARLAHAKRVLTFLDGLSQAVLILCASLCFLGCIAAAGRLYLRAEISAGQVMMLAIGALSCFECLTPLAAALLLLPDAERSARRVQELAAGKPRALGSAVLPDRPMQRMVCADLTLALPGRQEPVLEHFNYIFESNLNYALQGPSGCGKTTLLSALAGLIPPAQGDVFYDGIAGQELKPVSLHQHLTLCFQDPAFISGRLREMFRIVNPQATDAEILKLLDLVELTELVYSLPGQLDAFIDMHGSSLSGGQARRLSLALCLIKPADFVLLDEPGEGLDAAQEERILTRLFHSRTGIIMVTHKEQGLTCCDKILRLKEYLKE